MRILFSIKTEISDRDNRARRGSGLQPGQLLASV